MTDKKGGQQLHFQMFIKNDLIITIIINGSYLFFMKNIMDIYVTIATNFLKIQTKTVQCNFMDSSVVFKNIQTKQVIIQPD